MGTHAPLFTSAPRVRIGISRADGVSSLIGFAIGLNLNVSIDIQPINVIGEFSPINVEPTMYNPVTGTIQILRLLLPNKAINTTEVVNSVPAVEAVPADKESGTPAIEAVPGTEYSSQVSKSEASTSGEALSEGFISTRNLHMHFNPRSILSSKTFQLDFFIKVPVSYNGGPADQALANTAGVEGHDVETWMRIKNVRLTSRNTNITLGQLINQPINFQGLMLTPLGNQVVGENAGFEFDGPS